MGRQKHSDTSHHSPECSKSLLHIIKHHPLCHNFIQKRHAYKKESVIAQRDEAFSCNKRKNLILAQLRNSNVEEKVTLHSSVGQNTERNQIEVLIDENSRTKRCVQCDPTFSSDYRKCNLGYKHQPTKNDLLARKVRDQKKCRVEDIAKRNTFGVSTLLYKYFFGALETTNMNKEILLAFLHDPISPMVYHFHKQRVKRAKITLNRSESFPFHDSLPKWKGRLYCGNETQKLVQFESTKTFYEHVMPSVTKGRVNGNFNINEAEIVRDVNFSSGCAKGQKHKEIKHVNMNLKQKIEHVTGESEKEKIRVAMDSVIHKLPQGQGISDELKKEILKKLTDPIIKREVPYKNSIRRIKSLEEPLESYFKQKENSFKTEDIHLQYEKLKLVKEKTHSSPLRMLIPLERIRSLPDLQSFSYASPLSFNDQDIMAIKEYKASIAASVAVTELFYPMLKDSKSKTRPSDRPNNAVEQQVSKKDSLKVIKTTKNVQKSDIQTKKFNHEIPHIHVDTKDKDEFNYVKYVLEISGLTSNESLSSWHAKDTPLDPSLYEEMENDPEFCSHKGGQCNHHVLFDLINETMLEIYGRSHCCPPIGCHILHKVWTHMSKSLGLRYKVDQTIDDHVGRDFSSKSDGWVNHHIYDECVGLEIEDMIFHDLLEEIMLDLACL